MRSSRVVKHLSRTLAAAFHRSDDARDFLEDALTEAFARDGWRGMTRAAVATIADAAVSLFRPDGYAITAAALTVGDAVRRPSRSIFMDHLLSDIRFGLRQLTRHPGFALAAVLTMALGIGANTAIFSVAWHTLLQPLPYPHSEQLVEIWETFGSDNRPNLSMPAKYWDARNEARSFQTIAAYNGVRSSVDVTGAGEPQQLREYQVTEDYFAVFGMAPLLGRTLNAGDVHTDVTPVVISEELWRTLYEGRDDVIGRRVRLTGDPGVIVGVMPSAFQDRGGRADLWAPMTVPPPVPRTAGHFLRVIARLKPDVTIDQADAEMKGIAKRAGAANPQFESKLSANVTSLIDGRGTARGDASVQSGVWILALGAIAVLLIACANLASLQLARSVARGREFAIRTAIGASRGRVVKQLITEGLVISVLGAGVGLLLGGWLLHALRLIAPANVQTSTRLIDPIAAGYGLALAALSTVVFALAPSWRTANRALRWLRQRAESGDRASAHARLALVAGQIGAAAALLIGAALLISSLARVMRVDPGFNPAGALTFDLSFPEEKYGPFDARRAFIDRVDAELRALPGVTATCFINQVPFDGQGGMTYVPDGKTQDDAVPAQPQTVTPGCFDALGLTITRGRGFVDREPAPVAVVSESFAKAAWPGQDALGKRIHVGVVSGYAVDIVGVTGNTLTTSLEERAFPKVYMAWTPADYFQPEHVIVRAAVPPASLFPAIKSAIRRLDADQPVANLRTMNDVVGRTTAARRFMIVLLGTFAAVALVLAAIGMYGLLAETVAQRSAEFGVRLALGAAPGALVRLVMRGAALALAVGLPTGVVAAYWASGLLRRFMFRMAATDPAVYAGVGAVLTVIVLLAAWLPARRAAQVNAADVMK